VVWHIVFVQLAYGACLGLSDVYGEPSSVVFSDSKQAELLLEAVNVDLSTPFEFALLTNFEKDESGSTVSASL
jgi:hypothetical protein